MVRNSEQAGPDDSAPGDHVDAARADARAEAFEGATEAARRSMRRVQRRDQIKRWRLIEGESPTSPPGK